MPARDWHANPPRVLKRYKARNAMKRGLDWLKHEQRVVARYAPYAQRGLGFLYLAGVRFKLNSNNQHNLKACRLARTG